METLFETKSLRLRMPIVRAIRAAAPRPDDTALREQKKNYAERLSNKVADAVALRLRELGVTECQPGFEGGKERQFAGGIGAKKLDVSFATETAGLVLGISIKSISFPDLKTKNYSKNLTNRRGDLLAEATTLHQRFPYAVLGALFLFDAGASRDGTGRRPATVTRAHEIFKAFNNRGSRSNAVEKYERLGIVVYKASEPIGYKYFDVGAAESTQLDSFLLSLLERIADRNSDHFRFDGRKLEPLR